MSVVPRRSFPSRSPMSRFLPSIAGSLLVALSATAVTPVHAQLTLGEAFRQADRLAYGNRVAAANASAQNAQTLAPLKGVLPSIRIEAGYLRTTDPIGVFGATLRQRTITQAD